MRALATHHLVLTLDNESKDSSFVHRTRETGRGHFEVIPFKFSLVAPAKVDLPDRNPTRTCVLGFCEGSGSKVADLVAFLITFYNLALNEYSDRTVTHKQSG